jgi:aminotransferase
MRFADRISGLQHSDIRKWTRVIEERGGINLAQGICAVEPRPEFLQTVEHAYQAMKAGHNTYTHYSGIDALRHAIAAKAEEYNGIVASPDPHEGNIVVTAGATGAFVCAFNALVNPGDEVIFFEPFYNYHLNTLALAGGRPRFVQLTPPAWTFDPGDLDAAWTERTKAVVVNTPCNPSGKVFTREELAAIASFCQRRGIIAITDEVYEYMLFDDAKHVSLATFPGMAERTVTVTSFSKTLAITGWRVGYAIAPQAIAKHMGLVNEFTYACAPAPLQHAVVEAVQNSSQFRTLKDLYAPKRDLLAAALAKAGFTVNVPRGAYYILADHTPLKLGDDRDAVVALIEQAGVGAVPGSAFFSGGRGKNLLRFCFAFRDEGLREAAQRLHSRPAPRPHP